MHTHYTESDNQLSGLQIEIVARVEVGALKGFCESP